MVTQTASWLISCQLFGQGEHRFCPQFRTIQPVDIKVYNHLLDLKRAREPIEDAEEKIRRRIRPIFPPTGFTTVPPPGKAAREQRKFEVFQKSWRESIQALQDISTRVTKDEYRPDWVPPDTPPFLQADQFIHAYYFIKIGGHRGEAHVNAAYEEHKGNPEGALVEAMQWWKQSAFNYGEEYKHMVPWAKVMREAFAENRIPYLTKAEFVDALSKVHAIRAYGGKLVTAIGAVETADEKVLRHADRLWDAKSANGTSILDLLDYIIWGRDDIERRVWNGINDKERNILGLGYSALGEIVGWARPDAYPPRNDRSIKGIRALGIHVRAVT